jgi:RNA polymerase sigma-70 factor (ECF subfamily)
MDELPKVEDRRRIELNNVNANVTFALTVLPNEPALLRRARRLASSDADARDLVQETLERALRTFHAFRPGTAVWAWLRTIMNSVWIDSWRRRQAAARIASLIVEELAAPEPEPQLPAENTDAILARLPDALTRLPPIFREVLELRLLSNWSYDAIAGRLGIPSRTVGTRILRARRQLRTILEDELSLPPERERRHPRARARRHRTERPASPMVRVAPPVWLSETPAPRPPARAARATAGGTSELAGAGLRVLKPAADADVELAHHQAS